MTRDEMVKVLMVINEYWNIDIPDLTIKTNAWMHLLGKYDYRDVLAAVDEYMLTAEHKEWAPNQGKLIEIIERKNEPMINAQAYVVSSTPALEDRQMYKPMPDHIRRQVESLKREWGIYDD